MKIGSTESKAVQPAVGERKAGGASPAGKAASSGGAEASAKVELSDTLNQLSASSTEGVFDTAKVERISNAIRDGKFQINPEAIADKLISNAQELLSNVKNG